MGVRCFLLPKSKILNLMFLDVFYTDFYKTFDTVETGVLLHELRTCGVRGKLGYWLASFVDPSTRRQAVAINGRISSLTQVLSGVPGHSSWASLVQDSYQDYI